MTNDYKLEKNSLVKHENETTTFTIPLPIQITGRADKTGESISITESNKKYPSTEILFYARTKIPEALNGRKIKVTVEVIE